MAKQQRENGRFQPLAKGDLSPLQKVISLRCDERLVKEIDAAAAADGQTRSEWLLDAISQHLEQ